MCQYLQNCWAQIAEEMSWWGGAWNVFHVVVNYDKVQDGDHGRERSNRGEGMKKISEALVKNIEELQVTSSMTDSERGLEEDRP